MKYYCDDNAKTDKIIRKTYDFQLEIINTIKKKKRLGPIALKILYTTAYCNAQDLPMLIFTSLFSKWNDSTERSLMSILDLLVKYQLIDSYRKNRVQMISIHRVTRSNMQLMLQEEGIEEEAILRAIGLLKANIDCMKTEVKDDDVIVAYYAKYITPYLCSNAQHVLYHAKKYKTLDQPGKSLELLIDYFAQKELYRKQDFITINQ